MFFLHLFETPPEQPIFVTSNPAIEHVDLNAGGNAFLNAPEKNYELTGGIDVNMIVIIHRLILLYLIRINALNT